MMGMWCAAPGDPPECYVGWQQSPVRVQKCERIRYQHPLGGAPIPVLHVVVALSVQRVQGAAVDVAALGSVAQGLCAVHQAGAVGIVPNVGALQPFRQKSGEIALGSSRNGEACSTNPTLAQLTHGASQVSHVRSLPVSMSR